MSVHVFTLPDLGEGLTEAELLRWLVVAGDTVAVDEPVAEVETAKATVEIPSPFGGVVAELHGAEGSTLAVGAPLISVDDGADGDGGTAATSPADVYVDEERAGSGQVLIGYGTSGATSPRRRRRPRPAPPVPPVVTPAPSTAWVTLSR